MPLVKQPQELPKRFLILGKKKHSKEAYQEQLLEGEQEDQS